MSATQGWKPAFPFSSETTPEVLSNLATSASNAKDAQVYSCTVHNDGNSDGRLLPNNEPKSFPRTHAGAIGIDNAASAALGHHVVPIEGL